MQPADWSDHLRVLAEPVLRGTPLLDEPSPTADPAQFLQTFADDLGHRRAVDRPLLAHLLGVDPGPPPANVSLDVRLWWALHTGEPVDDLISTGPGPIIGEDAFTSGAIEITTETELAALHALAHHARAHETLEARCLDAARWHVETLQPDNGTNHPWAVHVFLRLAETSPDPTAAHEASLHAETLVHNALVSSGRPDRFSACLLLDAARALARGDPNSD